VVSEFSNIDDYADITPTEFARLVKATPESEMHKLLTGDHRKAVLDGIFARMPESFRAGRAADLDAVIQWTITGGPNGSDTYEIRIADGVCTTSATPSTDRPRLGITVAPVDFVRVVSGNANPAFMFMTGKLKAKGDMGLAVSIPTLFEVPKA
jgi:putative sterol carrier protein